MNKSKGRIGWLLLAVMLVLVVAACSSTDTDKEEANGVGETKQEGNASNEASDPGEVGYPESISYWVALNGNAGATMVDYNEMAAYKVMKEITGTNVEFQHPPAGQEQDQFSLMFSSGDLPDLVETNWLGVNVPGGPDNAINEGRILRLNELIEAHAPNLTRILDENPEWRKMITSDAGNIYTFPFIRGDEMLLTVHGPALRQDWLDQLGLDMPTTLEEWETVLTAFKEQDPNGNGVADEIPFLLEMGAINYGHAFIGAFGMTNGFYNDGGTIKFGPIEPEFQTFLTMLNRWYENGLIDQDYASSDGQLRDAKVSNNELGAYVTYAGSGIGRMNGLVRESNPAFQLMPAPYPKLNADADLPIGQQDPVFSGNGVAISTKASNPEEIVKWLDFKYGEEGHMLFNFGVEGESYEMVDGVPTYTDIIMNNPDGLPVTQAMARYFRAVFSGPMVQDKGYIEQYYEMPEQKQALVNWTQANHDKLMPPVTLTAEENTRYSSIMSEVNTHRDEMIDRFIMGASPMAEFQAFVDALVGMGIEEAIEIQQAAFDRYLSR